MDQTDKKADKNNFTQIENKKVKNNDLLKTKPFNISVSMEKTEEKSIEYDRIIEFKERVKSLKSNNKDQFQKMMTISKTKPDTKPSNISVSFTKTKEKSIENDNKIEF